jgi:hypothetical protein
MLLQEKKFRGDSDERLDTSDGEFRSSSERAIFGYIGQATKNEPKVIVIIIP